MKEKITWCQARVEKIYTQKGQALVCFYIGGITHALYYPLSTLASIECNSPCKEFLLRISQRGNQVQFKVFPKNEEQQEQQEQQS